MHAPQQRMRPVPRDAPFGFAGWERWAAGKFCDDIYMECLAADFVSPVLRAIFEPDAGPPDKS